MNAFFFIKKNLAILQEFVQQRTHLENQQKKLNNLNIENDEKRKNFPITSKKFADDEHEEKFFKQQQTKQNQESTTNNQHYYHKEEINHPFENSIGSTSSEDNNNPDLNDLKKSMHKGASSAAFLLSKLKKSNTNQSFSPIIKLDSKISNSKSFDNDSTTPRNHPCQVINPIPIRLSASSSVDSTQIIDDNQLNSSRISINNKSLNEGLLTPSNLKITNSKIWKSASVTPSTTSGQPAISSATGGPTEKKTWSSLLAASNEEKQSKTSLLSHLSNLSKLKNK